MYESANLAQLVSDCFHSTAAQSFFCNEQGEPQIHFLRDVERLVSVYVAQRFLAFRGFDVSPGEMYHSLDFEQSLDELCARAGEYEMDDEMCETISSVPASEVKNIIDGYLDTMLSMYEFKPLEVNMSVDGIVRAAYQNSRIESTIDSILRQTTGDVERIHSEKGDEYYQKVLSASKDLVLNRVLEASGLQLDPSEEVTQEKMDANAVYGAVGVYLMQQQREKGHKPEGDNLKVQLKVTVDDLKSKAFEEVSRVFGMARKS